MRAVCSVFVPPWMPSSRSGRGTPSSSTKTVRQLVVVVLAGVDEQLVVLGAQQARDRGRLDELRPVPDDRDDPQGSARGGAELLHDQRADALVGLARERAGDRGQLAPVDRADRQDLAHGRGEERLPDVGELVGARSAARRSRTPAAAAGA